MVILVGLQAAGKSTFRRTQLGGHVVVSKDLMPNNRNPGRRQVVLIDEALSAGSSVVVDNTNPRVADRATLIEQARRHGARVIGYYFTASLDESLERNRLREGKARVPDVALIVTAKAFIAPCLAEGFDELFQVRIAADGRWVVAPDAEGARR